MDLGSCVGLFVKDRRSGITGGAHIFLPEANHDISFVENMSAGDCVQQMLEQMREKGASLETMRAKIAGGSNVLMNFNEIGSRNTNAVIERAAPEQNLHRCKRCRWHHQPHRGIQQQLGTISSQATGME